MRYLIDISNTQNERINNLINQGRYQSIASFILSALENQLYLEESPPDVLSSKEMRPNAIAPEQVVSYDKSIREMSSLLSADIGDVAFIKPPADSKIIPKALSKDSDSHFWIWGQVNRIFPLKFGLRVLGNLLKQNKAETIDPRMFRDIAAQSARNVGLRLMAFEKMKNVKRKERISAGLPVGDQAFNSESRYKTHFLATVRVTDEGKEMLDGALAKLKFVNIEIIEKKEKIGITKEGLEFAKLENPILDKQEYDVTLSNAEVDYYLRHIAENIPGEYRAIKLIFSIIAKGTNRRESINKELSRKYPEWTPETLNTQRAGLMSRMFELRLLERDPDKKGVGVTYRISKAGEDKIK
jgi:Arc/MetJ-type ribon-helix-helix transcriptional regulator